MSDIISLRSGGVAHYDPEDGLKSIAVAKAAESHFARAKNPDRLFEAVEFKLVEQRNYVIWRDGVVAPYRGGDGSNQFQRKGRKRATIALPDADPGKHVIAKWRKKLKTEEAFRRTLQDSKLRCLRFCEQETVARKRKAKDAVRRRRSGTRAKGVEANEFIRELLEFTSDYSDRIIAWHEANPDLDSEDKEAMMRTIHQCADMVLGLAQAIDGR